MKRIALIVAYTTMASVFAFAAAATSSNRSSKKRGGGQNVTGSYTMRGGNRLD
ncbi:MAG: hypothetical protein H0W99_07700, partial [Acidobacteria bacterium]|nr:hypothetical protein [Acidobacteriota bacterium]